MTITICENSTDGHRLGYVNYFRKEAESMARGARVEPSLWRSTWAAGPLVIPMLEQRTAKGLLAVTVRAMLRRRSLCLVFRAGEAVRSSSWRLAIKRALLGAAKRLPRTGLISIVPVPVEPAIEPLVNGWIYDPELCDLEREALERDPSPATTALRERAAGRVLIVALGRQSAGKGFGFFCDLWTSCPEIRRQCLFVAGGTVPPALADAAERFVAAGGVLLEGHLGDAELLDLYAVADAVWCCYSPDYDQASGIFGRAVQFGKPTIVRRGSHVERFAAHIAHPAQGIGWHDRDDAKRGLMALAGTGSASVRGARNAEMVRHNREVFQRYLAW